MARRRWIDPRLIIGGGLVVASIVGVWLVVDATTRSSTVWVASATLLPGDVIGDDDVVQAQLAFDGAEGVYLDGDEDPAGLVVLSTIGEGEALPSSALGAADEAGLAPVVVTAEGGLPSTLDAGTVVDLWAAAPADEGGFGAPSVLVDDAIVVGVVESEGLIVDDAVEVEVLVPQAQTAAVLDAIANQHVLSLVPTAPGGDA